MKIKNAAKFIAVFLKKTGLKRQIGFSQKFKTGF